ncbi:FadR/GntR family transcriptional regulator [Paenibacillus oceani]|uniref:FadR family transcriptional regulator n=1 Tax=Paenibacillus oceani TaxID=2772510 RepID=A0A927C4Y4_9BACL|nr:GntR family transcriptional regulator [Paenibacillus oceani]MBD2861434.1 FadR family transcriptional regulator [Paenibacillus oceani]
MKPIETAERYTLSKLVVHKLKQYIVEHNIAPGDKLPAERELSQTMKVSRAILREALRSLESAGILEIRHGEGAFISANSLSPLLEQLSFAAQLNRKGGRELLEIRYLLEASAVDAVLEQGRNIPFAELERLNEEWASSAGSESRQTEADVNLHLAVVQPLLNSSFTSLAELFIRQAAASTGTDRSHAAAIYEQHSRYIRLLREGKALEAKALLREHLGL